MFAEKLDSLMNVAEISNSLLGREVNMNPSYIGRLRSGARPLPKKHEYLGDMCRYLAGHISKDYQINALQKLTGIGGAALASPKNTARYLQRWLLEQESSAAAGRLISGFSRVSAGPAAPAAETETPELPRRYAAYLYGDAGKRKAVEQFFAAILQEEKPRTLLLFSDENMAWLYEDAAFAARWTELFSRVIMRGNRVKIIHTVSRDLNEMLEAVTKWIPIYMTGMIEPYCYPRLRDGVFRRTLFIAPGTAAVVSSSVQQDTEGMLNMFITDRSAVEALTAEYEHYFTLCRPLMQIFTPRDADAISRLADDFADAEGAACLCSALPPLFTMPETVVKTLAAQPGEEALWEQWKRSAAVFQAIIKNQPLTLVLKNPDDVRLEPDRLCPPGRELFSAGGLSYTAQQYAAHIEYLEQLEKRCKNLKVRFVRETADNTLLYMKENVGVIMAKSSAPRTAFVISEKNMVSAFWDYIGKCILP